MKRLIGAPVLALFGAFAFLAITLNSCSNPSSSPGTTVTTADYSASGFFGTEPLGDSSVTPFPFCFPVQYLQQQLGLSDSQVIALQNLQDSLRTALQARLAAPQAGGTLTLDSIRALRLEYQTELYTGVAAILTPAQFTALQSLVPPLGPRGEFGRGPRFLDRGNDHDADDSARVQLTPSQMDSVGLLRLEALLARSGDTLTAAEILQIQNLQDTLRADTTLTPEGRRAEFEAQLQTILTANQLAALLRSGESDHRPRRWHG